MEATPQEERGGNDGDGILAMRDQQEFPDRKAAARFVRDFALSQGKRAVVNYKLSGGNSLYDDNPVAFRRWVTEQKNNEFQKCLRLS